MPGLAPRVTSFLFGAVHPGTPSAGWFAAADVVAGGFGLEGTLLATPVRAAA